jgi:hypothetical protein
MQDSGERPRGWARRERGRGSGRRVLSSPPPARRGGGGEGQLGGGNAHCRACGKPRASDKSRHHSSVAAGSSEISMALRGVNRRRHTPHWPKYQLGWACTGLPFDVLVAANLVGENPLKQNILETP